MVGAVGGRGGYPLITVEAMDVLRFFCEWYLME